MYLIVHRVAALSVQSMKLSEHGFEHCVTPWGNPSLRGSVDVTVDQIKNDRKSLPGMHEGPMGVGTDKIVKMLFDSCPTTLSPVFSIAKV